MKDLALIPNHVEQAKARLLQQYMGKPRLAALLTAIINPLQDMEAAFFDLLEDRALATASGFQLDRLGSVVGIDRDGLDDDSYRLRIRARILVNISEGTPEQLILIYKLLTLATFVLYRQWAVGVSLMGDTFLSDPADVAAVYELMEEAALAGVRVEEMGYFDSTNPLALAGTVLPYGTGLGSTADLTTGGKIAQLYVIGKEFALAGSDASAGGLGTLVDPLVGGRLLGL